MQPPADALLLGQLDQVVPVLATVLIGAIVVLLFLALVCGPMAFGQKALHRRFEGLRLHSQPEPGDVYVVYHTYRGVLVYFVQTEHRVLAPPDDARELLRRLLRYNLTWGLLCWFGPLVPFLALGNYYGQLRSIERQVGQSPFAG
jgi:hypothetical protein